MLSEKILSVNENFLKFLESNMLQYSQRTMKNIRCLFQGRKENIKDKNQMGSVQCIRHALTIQENQKPFGAFNSRKMFSSQRYSFSGALLQLTNGLKTCFEKRLGL